MESLAKIIIAMIAAALPGWGYAVDADTTLLRYVNPFIGTTNYGTTNPGAVCPNGMMSVSPFNVMGSAENRYDKDSRWWSTPYDNSNSFFTGFSHVNLSGVGCPDLASLLVMPTTGELCVDFAKYGSPYTGETASPGYYATTLTDYGIRAEVTATPRTAIHRYTFPEGMGHILINLAEGLTNESGAYIRQTGPGEFEGMKLLGTFCYNPGAVFPMYFIIKANKRPTASGFWKKQRKMKGIEAEWTPDNGQYKIYGNYHKAMAGDDIGAFLSFDTSDGEQVELSVGVSFVSTDGARRNLQSEQQGRSFDQILAAARSSWADNLGRISVEGGTDEQKTVFYTALYHILLHPNILNDADGRYPAMESDSILTTSGRRYTVFSLWDTYRNVHPLLTLVYPRRQREMVRTMIEMYRESGWLPKWELYGRETNTMEGDPASIVIADTWLRGLRGFDITTAYEAMRKSAFTPGAYNRLRPDNSDYMRLGYVPLRSAHDNSVASALEYYVADAAIARLADTLGHKDDAKILKKRSLGYRHYYSAESGTLRPLLPDGSFLTPFNPRQGENFEPVPGFHEGSAWNYTFSVPHDVAGLARLMGGKERFVEKLQSVFSDSLYDPANEPDIAYAHLFSRFKGEEWRTQREVARLLRQYFKNSPSGIPGNEDTGTMSAWAVLNMLGLYPDCPGDPSFTLTAPTFSRAVIRLDREVWGRDSLVITAPQAGEKNIYIKEMKLGGQPLNRYRVTQDELIKAGRIDFTLSDKPKGQTRP